MTERDSIFDAKMEVALVQLARAPVDRDTRALADALHAVAREPPDADVLAAAFAHRRLLLFLADVERHHPDDQHARRAAELAEVILDAAPPTSSAVGLTPRLDFGDEVHRKELYPDVSIVLQRPLRLAAAAAHDVAEAPIDEDASAEQACRDRLELRGACSDIAFDPVACSYARGAAHVPPPPPQDLTISMRALSRRERLGSEIECKIWPAAAILSRWLWLHPWLLRGCHALELGAGVGMVGLAASACGAASVLITDINGKALSTARDNCRLNAPLVAAAARVARLDWGKLPELDAAADGGDEPGVWCAATDAALEPPHGRHALFRRYDVVLAADVVNADGLPELMLGAVERYLASDGLFVMCAPRPRHRHTVGELRGRLVSHDRLDVRVTPVPLALAAGIDETDVVAHELYHAQWKRS